MPLLVQKRSVYAFLYSVLNKLKSCVIECDRGAIVNPHVGHCQWLIGFCATANQIMDEWTWVDFEKQNNDSNTHLATALFCGATIGMFAIVETDDIAICSVVVFQNKVFLPLKNLQQVALLVCVWWLSSSNLILEHLPCQPKTLPPLLRWCYPLPMCRTNHKSYYLVQTCPTSLDCLPDLLWVSHTTIIYQF